MRHVEDDKTLAQTGVMAETVPPEWRLQDRLLRALDQTDITVQQMADELGVSRTTVSNYLHGRTEPNRSTLRVWAMRCGVPFTWLATGTEPDGKDGTDTTPVTLWYSLKAAA